MFFKSLKTHTLIGRGIPLNDPTGSIRNIWLRDAERKAHMFCLGATRMGKTKIITNMIKQDIFKGNNVVVIDPKGDTELLSGIVQDAFAAKRQDELCLITPIYPNLSVKIDPLAYYYIPEEIVSHVVSGVKANEAFFENIALETTTVIVLSLIIFQEMNPTLENHINVEAINKRCSYEGLRGLMAGLQDINTDEATEIKLILKNVLNSPADYFSKVSSSLRTVLTELSIGNVGKIIGKARSNFFIKRLEENKRVILIVQTGCMLTRRSASTVGRILVSMIQSFVGRRYLSGKMIEPPLSLYIDEFSNVAYRGIADMFSKSAGANVRIHAFTQSIADLNEEVGPDSCRKILDNCNSKIFMRVNDVETAEYIAEYSGRIKKYSPILSQDMNSVGGGILIRQIEEPAIQKDDVLNLKPRDFYLFSFNGGFKGRTVPVKPLRICVQYPEINVLNRVGSRV